MRRSFVGHTGSSTRAMTTSAIIPVREIVIGTAIPMSATCSQRRLAWPGGANRAQCSAMGRHIASTQASSIGSVAVAEGRLRLFRVSRSVKTTVVVSPGILM